MADLEELIVRIKADAGQLEREMKKAQGIVQQSGKGMADALKSVERQALSLLPALSAGAILAFGVSAFKAADHLNDLAQRTGIAASTLSAFNIPLLQSGSNVDEFSGSINRMNNLIGEAAKGTSKEAIQAFDDLGLSVKALQQLSPEEQFYAIADALGKIGNQATFTNAGMSIFGKSFSSIAPVIKESGGNLQEFVEQQKKLGNALTEDQLKKIDELGDKYTNMAQQFALASTSFLPVIEAVTSAIEAFNKANAAGSQALGFLFSGKTLPDYLNSQNPNVSFTKPETVTEATFLPKSSGGGGAKGSNAGLLNNQELKQAQEELKKYNEQLMQQHELSMLAPADAAQRKAYYDLLSLAQKAGIKDAEAYAQAHSQIAAETYKLAEAQEEAARFTAELKDQFAEMAADVIFNAENMGDAFRSLGEELAKMILKKQLLGPLSDALFGGPGMGGGIFGNIFGNLFSGLGFAEGGEPPIGQASVVGENGPELFVPKTAGTIIPNSAMGGGQSVVIQQNFQITPGAEEVFDRKMRAVAPVIAAAAHDAVFASMRTGGSSSKIAGLR